MPGRGKTILTILILTTAFIILFITLMPSKTEKSNPPEKEAEKEKLFMAYYDKGWGEETRGLPSFQKHHKNLDMVCPNWYGVNSSGDVVLSRGEIEKEITRRSRQENVKVLPLFTSLKSSHRVLANKELTEKAAINISELVKKKNYHGVNIDFEYISKEYSRDLTRLIKLLAEELPEDKIIAVSVFPKIDFPESLHGLHEYEALAEHADYICLMAYDRHSPETGPGPVAPLLWVETNVQNALESVSPEQLILGLGAYGYDWNHNGGVNALSINQSKTRSEKHDSEILWDSDSSFPYFSYRENGNQHEVWFENAKSTALKAKLVQEYDLAGITFWRLGFENDAYITELKKSTSNY